MSTRTHYDTLGVSPDASGSRIREAYRDLARRYHPDRLGNGGGSGSAAGADRMPEVNEAYRVLSDPARRAMYDASLRSGSAPARSGRHTATEEPPVERAGGVPPGHDDDYAVRLAASRQPIRVPWRTIAVLAGSAVLAVLVLAQFTDGSDDPVIDGILRIGDCAEVLPDRRAQEVPCADLGGSSGDLVVRAMVPFEETCSGGLSRHQDRQGMGNVCLEQMP